MRVQERTRGRKWTRIRKAKLMQNPLCEHCDRRGVVSLAKEVDHIVSLEAGGTDDPSNLQSLCKDCHYKKTQKDQGNTYKVAYDKDGMPIDNEHQWNK